MGTVDKPLVPQLNLTLQTPSASFLSGTPLGFDSTQKVPKIQSTSKKAMPQLPK